MKNRKLARLGLIGLSAALIATSVFAAGAARFVGDVNGDGKVSVFDAQMLVEEAARVRKLTAEQEAGAGNSTVASVLDQVWGLSTTPVDSDGDGAFELSTANDLTYMAVNPSLSYELTGNIDLQGAEWTPIKSFTGSLNGNGYSISNCVINTSVDDIAKTGDNYNQNMGFFGDIEKTGSVTDLKLRDITVNADEDTGYIGILVGTNRGSVSGVNVTGTINDDRTDVNGNKIYIGAVAGMIASSSTGTIVCDASLSVTDDLSKQTTTGLCADVRMHIPKTEDKVVFGLVGWSPNTKRVTGLWCDSANDSAQLSKTMQNRQKVVVDYMDAMATVAWQVSEPLIYSAREGGSVVQTFVPGITYYGLPYTSMNGSLERFMTQIDSSSGTNITVTGLDSSYYHEISVEGTNDILKGYNGFAQYMGNDCSAAVGWSWLRVSPIRVSGGESEYAGGVYPRFAIDFIPNSKGQSYGIYPVGDWTTVSSTNDSVTGTFLYEVPDDQYNSKYVYDTYGAAHLYEAYAISRTADALVYMVYDNNSQEGGGHARLLVADPIVIRNADGSVDAQKSYVLCTEQGDGLGDRKNTHSSWRHHYKYTFSELINLEKSRVFIPIAIRALRSDMIKDAYANENPNFPITGPASGRIYSNFRVISSTVKVSDAKGNVVYNNTVFTGISDSMHAARDRYNDIDLATYHGEAFAAAAEAAGLTSGKKCYYTIELLLSNGETKTIVKNAIFTYTPAE